MAEGQAEPQPRPLLLGMGWSPDEAGGLSRYLRNLHDALRAGGTEACTLVLGPATDPSAGVEVVGQVHESLPRRLAGFVRGARAHAGHTDVVDSHFALYGAAPVLAGPLRGKPLVVHFQGPWADESRSSGQSSAAVLAAKRSVERALYGKAREIVVLSSAFKRLLVESYRTLPWRVTVVPPGVDLGRFSPGDGVEARRRLGVPIGAWVCVAVRRLVPRTGVDVLLRAWAELSHGPGDTLLVVGDGPTRPSLAELASRLGAEGVRFLGRVDEDDLVAAYRAADVCVVPTTELEGFGLVVLEALACGTPVVATDVDGLADALGDLDASATVPAGDHAALAQRLDGARSGAAPLPSAARCRRYAERFSWAKVAERNREVYRRALDPAPARPLRVVYVDHCALASGGEIALARMLPALEGVEPHVVLGEDGPLARLLAAAGISTEVLPMPEATRSLRRDRVTAGRLPVKSVLQSGAYVVRLAAWLRRLRPDAVHTNSLKAALYGGVAGRLAGVPVIWHVRDRISSDYLPGPAVGLVRGLARRIPHAVVANSETTLATLGPAPHGQVRRVVFDPTPEPSPPVPLAERAEFCCGMVGRITPWKGQHVFVDAFARAFGGEAAARAVVVGAPLFGEESYAQECRELARKLGVADRVEFAGFQADVTAQLRRFDVLVHASVIPEPFGLVVIEGMAAGLPVVAARAGGPAEVVTDGQDGLLYPPGDAAALAELLRRLAADPVTRSRLGETARARARDFSPAAIAAEMRALYDEVVPLAASPRQPARSGGAPPPRR